MSGHRIIDLFAGAGGWEEGLARLGHRALGIEFDSWAAATARAAGHDRLQADVAALDPRDFGPIDGLIASPPCQAYSTAGKGLGRADKPRVIACAHELAAGNDTRAEHAEQCRDPRSLLTVEPLRWALALKPWWIALEQVPAVLELWSEFAGLLAVHGYHVAAGILSAEQYGVPQSRRRAFLIASRRGPVKLPAPSHRSYNPRHPDRVPEHERELLPWVSMGQALGWTGPAVACTHAHTNGGRRPFGQRRPVAHPARTLDTSSGAWRIHPRDPDGRLPAALDNLQNGSVPRTLARPAFTICSSSPPAWISERPATTILGDPRVHPPGHKQNSSDPPDRYEQRRGVNAVRVTVEQASVLQGFRPDYPWQGSRARQFRQIGNAVCPPLARHVLAQAMRTEGAGDAR
jgi:DNA (cytosine-5)-methyltransferase 1